MPLLLALIAILLVGGGIYVYENKKVETPITPTSTTAQTTNQPVTENSVLPQTTQTTQTKNQTAPVTQTSNSKISDWKTYAKDGFQMQYPSQYEVRKQNVAGSYATISFQASDANRVLGVNVTSGNCKDLGSNIKTSQVTINGTSFIKGDVSNDFSGMQTRASAVEYCAMSNGGAYKIIPRIFFSKGGAVLDVDKDPVFNQMISSFKITPTITTASSVTGQNFVMVSGETAHVWGANLINNGTITTTVFIGSTKVSALPPSEMSNDNGFNFVVPSSLVAGQSYDLYVTNNIGTSNVVRVKILASSPTSTTPTVSYLNPTSVKVGDTITVYGSNLYGTIFSLDNLWGTTDNSIYQDPSGTSFSFVVPTEMKSVGTHSLQVDGAIKPVTFTIQ